MKVSDLFVTLLYGVVFLFIVYLVLLLIRRLNRQPTVIVVGDETPVYDENVWWPWAYGPYNWWPYWFPWAAGGYGAYNYYRGGGRRHWSGGRPWGAHGGVRGAGGAHGPISGSRGGAGGARGGGGGRH